MTTIIITCPKCQFSREIPSDKIPASARQANCPRCEERFPLPPRTSATPPAAATTADISPGEQPTPPEVPAVPPGEPTTPPPTETPAVPAPVSNKPRRIPFSFTGTSRDYFGIWIVNALLKVLTLGLYSPWAKVRKRRYFFGHTLIDRANFDYLADPMALLRGMLLAFALYMGYGLLSNLIPVVGQIIGLTIFLAIPWLIVRSRMFNCRYSNHRNIRFAFIPNYREAYIAYAGIPLLSIFTLGLLLPYAAWRQKRFIVEQTRYGRTPFTFHAEVKDYYLIALKTFGMLLLVIALFTAGTMATTTTFATLGEVNLEQAGFGVMIIAGYFALIAAYLMVVLFWQVRVINLTWSSTRIGQHRLQSALRTRDMIWIYLSSGIAIMLSFGLLIPWAAVRLARYRISRTSLIVHGDLDNFVNAVADDVDAAGEEISDLFDVDIELGF
ncbi:MAG: hypothetical protein C0624_13615 [Desulfuromonas sp.]|nr:MAG: hypothetical protein C0624_13615 [Desulfuromonas sp.]